MGETFGFYYEIYLLELTYLALAGPYKFSFV